MPSPILLCCDMDGTVVSYGEHRVLDAAQKRFRSLASHPQIVLAYVTGRTPDSARQAISEHGLPVPRYLVGDVGSTVLEWTGNGYRLLSAWWDRLALDWAGVTHRQILDAVLNGLPGVWLQENEAQSPCKACFYTDYDVDGETMVAQVRPMLERMGARSLVEWSRDEVRRIGYLDVLPLHSGKLGAVRFLQERLQVPQESIVFAGDAGNDLSVLGSGLRAIMPKNGQPHVHEEAMCRLKKMGLQDRLYLARGDFLGLDGIVLSGVLEGLAWHFPETGEWMA